MSYSNVMFKSIGKHKRYHAGSYIIQTLVVHHLMEGDGW